MHTNLKACLVMGCLVRLRVANAEQYPFDSDQWQVKATEAAVLDHIGRRSAVDQLLQGGK